MVSNTLYNPRIFPRALGLSTQPTSYLLRKIFHLKMSSSSPLSPSTWDLGIHDAHCHPTDTMSATAQIPSMKTRTLTIMGTRPSDLPLVASLATTYPDRVIPSFGLHPWFSHFLYDDTAFAGDVVDKKAHYGSVLIGDLTDEVIDALPQPVKLSEALGEVRGYLEKFPGALVGEIGIDRGFRIPFPEGCGGSGEWRRRELGEEDDEKRLSPYRVSMEHQKRVFVAQLKLAGEFGRAVSVHVVQCHGAVFDVFKELWKGFEVEVESKTAMRRRKRLEKDGYEYITEGEWREEEVGNLEPRPYPPRICLHSFSAPVEMLKQYITAPSPTKRFPSQVYFSFSSTVNADPEKGHRDKINETIKAVPGDRVLVESDMHTAGEFMDGALEEAVKVVAGIRGTEIDHCVKMLGDNWKAFVLGGG